MIKENPETNQITSMFREANIQNCADDKPVILTSGPILQAPGTSPMLTGLTRRKKYTDMQIDECISLSRVIGTALACEKLGVNPCSLYSHARLNKLKIGKSAHKRKSRVAKYSPEQLTKVVKRALAIHANVPQAASVRKCCMRAGESFRINGHSVYSFYNLHRAEFNAGLR